MPNGIPDALDLKPVDYDPFAAEKYANPAVANIGQGIADLVSAPGRYMQPNPYPNGTEEWFQYEHDREQYGLATARNVALATMGGGAAGAEIGAGEAALGAGPIRAYHGSVKDIGSGIVPSKSGEFGPGAYFADTPEMASFWGGREGSEGLNITPVDLNLKNPFTVTKQDWVQMTRNKTPMQVQKKLKESGYDGIIGIGSNGLDKQIIPFDMSSVTPALKQIEQAPPGIRAYHGSPHDFDAFDTSKIGTGEGAQAYGHGLYFAEKEGTAKAYRDALSGSNIERVNFWDNNAGTLADMGSKRLAAMDAAKSAVQMHPDHAKSLVNDIEHGIMEGTPPEKFVQEYEVHPPYRAAYEAAANQLRGIEYKHNPGRMYEVQINADPEHFLDWDKPLSEQHPVVKQALQTAMRPSQWEEFHPAQAGTAMKQGFIGLDEQIASEKLRDAGLPGIKYLDQGSRSAGEGSRNYVVFDHNLIDIVKKYGLAGISMLPPAASAFLSQRITPVDHNPFAQGGNPALTPVDHDPFNPDKG